MNASLCQLVLLQGELQKIQNILRNLYRRYSRVIIDDLNIIHTLVAVINIIQLMIPLQLTVHQLLPFSKLLLVLCVNGNAGYGIKIRQILHIKGLLLLSASHSPAAGNNP